MAYPGAHERLVAAMEEGLRSVAQSGPTSDTAADALWRETSADLDGFVLPQMTILDVLKADPKRYVRDDILANLGPLAMEGPDAVRDYLNEPAAEPIEPDMAMEWIEADAKALAEMTSNTSVDSMQIFHRLEKVAQRHLGVSVQEAFVEAHANVPEYAHMMREQVNMPGIQYQFRKDFLEEAAAAFREGEAQLKADLDQLRNSGYTPDEMAHVIDTQTGTFAHQVAHLNVTEVASWQGPDDKLVKSLEGEWQMVSSLGTPESINEFVSAVQKRAQGLDKAQQELEQTMRDRIYTMGACISEPYHEQVVNELNSLGIDGAAFRISMTTPERQNMVKDLDSDTTSQFMREVRPEVQNFLGTDRNEDKNAPLNLPPLLRSTAFPSHAATPAVPSPERERPAGWRDSLVNRFKNNSQER